MTTDFFQLLEKLILTTDVDEKCLGITTLNAELGETTQSIDRFKHSSPVIEIAKPGLPEKLKLVAPKNLSKRGINSVEGRLVLMHSLAHIEFNAINLAMDAAYRYRNQPSDFYLDWLQVAADEARHFKLIEAYLVDRGVAYGDYVAHNGLWEMAVQTSHDVLARMALVPRVLEARGLDVAPAIMEKLRKAQDMAAVEILNTIYLDEIEHVKIGSKWFSFECQNRNLDPRDTFVRLVNTHFHGKLMGPFNMPARLLAGFDQDEIESFK